MKTIDKKQMVETINNTEAALMAYIDENSNIKVVAMADSAAVVFDLATAVAGRLELAADGLLN